jgi:hypothetical protein
MFGVFQKIDPPTPLTTFGAGGGHTRWVKGGVGVNILEDTRHSSVLYICKYFVLPSNPARQQYVNLPPNPEPTPKLAGAGPSSS